MLFWDWRTCVYEYFLLKIISLFFIDQHFSISRGKQVSGFLITVVPTLCSICTSSCSVLTVIQVENVHFAMFSWSSEMSQSCPSGSILTLGFAIRFELCPRDNQTILPSNPLYSSGSLVPSRCFVIKSTFWVTSQG